jgi:hypothetical protein
MERDRQHGTCTVWSGNSRSAEWQRAGGRRLESGGCRSHRRNLPNGKVLFAGGCVNNCNDITSSAELFDPASGTWSYTGSLHTPRYFYSAVLLNTGKVLVAGGCNAASCNTVTATAELYDPSTGAFSATGSLSVARDYQAAALLANGNVLVAGGFGTTGTLTQAEVYNPSTGRWTSAGNMATGRSQHTATLLPNG